MFKGSLDPKAYLSVFIMYTKVYFLFQLKANTLYDHIQCDLKKNQKNAVYLENFRTSRIRLE
jgi:hypothetical protein